MSGIMKGVKKVFKKVGAGGLVAGALAAGAIVFTAGAALGVSGMEGGWGGAVSSLSDRVFGQGSTLGNVLSGAITTAGYGAVAGGATSMLGGGDPLKGAMYGAAGGAVTGGLLSAAGMEYDPFKGIGEDGGGRVGPSDMTPGTSRDITNFNQPAGGLAGGPGNDPIAMGGGAENVFTGSPTLVSGPGSDTITGGGRGGLLGGVGDLFSKGGWLERNGALAGSILQGVGKAVGGSEGDAYLRAQQQRTDAVRQNYGAPGAGLVTSAPRQAAGATPADRFNPGNYGPGRWVFDPSVGRVVFVPQQQA